MNIKTTSYHYRSGNPARPMKSQLITKPAPTFAVIMQSNPPQPGDTTITLAQYNTAVANLEAQETAWRNAVHLTRSTDVHSATVKLLALGLTQGEIDALTA